MDSEARDGPSDAGLADDAADDVVDCTVSGRRSTSLSSVSDDVVAGSTTSGSCSPQNVDSPTEDVDDAGPPTRARNDVEAAPATTASSTSVPLLEELVSSPCEVVTPVQTSSAADIESEGRSSLDKSFLQKLESFVSSVGQVVPSTIPRPPFPGWMRRPMFSFRPGASGGEPMAARRPGPYSAVSAAAAGFCPSPSGLTSSRPLDLSAKRTGSPAHVPPEPRRASWTQHDGGVDGSFVDMAGEAQSNDVNFLACLERDFGEHSTILTRLGSSRDRQRQSAAAAALATTASRRGRPAVAAMPALTTVRNSPAAALCSSGTVAAPDLHPPRPFPPLPATDRACVLDANKLTARHVMSTTTAAALRCLQCARAFHSLPELTLHMIQTAHYANLICAAAAYGVGDDDDCVVVDAYDRRRSSNADRYTEALQLARGKCAPEVANVRSGGGETGHRGGYVDAAVSPARSLDDDESVSSVTESPRSSTGSPTSPPSRHDNDDELTIMSHLLPLLSRTTAVDRPLAGAALPYHVDWMAVGLQVAAAEERRRQLLVGRSSKSSGRQLDPRSSASDPLPIDLRSHRADGTRYRDSHSRQMPCLAAKVPVFAARESPAAYLEKLLDDVRGYRKPLSSAAGVKRPSSWYNGKHRTKRRRTYVSASDCAKNDGQQLNGDRAAGVDPTSGEVLRRKHDDAIREVSSGVKTSSSSPLAANHERHSSRRQLEKATDGARRATPRGDVAVQPIVVDGSADSPELCSVRGRDADVPTAAGRDFRPRPGVGKDQSEYAARFGKYYRLAQELSSKSD